MKIATRLLVAGSLGMLSGTAAAGLVPVQVSTPATWSLMGLGVIVAVLVARNRRR